jgi:hypothetical protein
LGAELSYFGQYASNQQLSRSTTVLVIYEQNFATNIEVSKGAKLIETKPEISLMMEFGTIWLNGIAIETLALASLWLHRRP